MTIGFVLCLTRCLWPQTTRPTSTTRGPSTTTRPTSTTRRPSSIRTTRPLCCTTRPKPRPPCGCRRGPGSPGGSRRRCRASCRPRRWSCTRSVQGPAPGPGPGPAPKVLVQYPVQDLFQDAGPVPDPLPGLGLCPEFSLRFSPRPGPESRPAWVFSTCGTTGFHMKWNKNTGSVLETGH